MPPAPPSNRSTACLVGLLSSPQRGPPATIRICVFCNLKRELGDGDLRAHFPTCLGLLPSHCHSHMRFCNLKRKHGDGGSAWHAACTTVPPADVPTCLPACLPTYLHAW